MSEERIISRNTIRMFLDGSQHFKTDSDKGGVSVGNANFRVCIPNGEGDGVTEVYIVKKGEPFDFRMLHPLGVSLSGKIDIYSYDCGDEIETTIFGTYFTYCYKGIVVFEEC